MITAQLLVTFVLTDNAEPDCWIEFDFGRWNQNGMVTGIDTTETPQDKAEAVVRVETECDVTGRIQLTLQLHRATQGRRRCVGHLSDTFLTVMYRVRQ